MLHCAAHVCYIIDQWFSFFFVNRSTCCKVSNAACCTCIWQLKYIFYFTTALYVWLL